MRRPYVLAECNWREMKDYKPDLVVLPWGACEAHNFHLPYATDIIEGDNIAHESARKAYDRGAKVIVLPTIPFGVNTGQTDITLDMNIHPSTQHLILNDTIEVLNRQGIYKLLVLNSHGGNNFKTMLRELGVKYPEMLLTSCDWFRALDKTKYFEIEGDHADEMETSLIMHLTPHLVDRIEEAGDGSQRLSKIEAIQEGWAWAERRWSSVTADTGIGDPSKASPEKGRAFFDDVTTKISELMVDLSQVDRHDLYL